MSDKVGRVAVSEPAGRGPFMGARMMRRPPSWGGRINHEIDGEVERLVNNSYLTAKKILTDNRDLLEHLSNVLMDQENVSAEEFQMMLVQFKAKTINYAILGEERNRAALPFQKMPSMM